MAAAPPLPKQRRWVLQVYYFRPPPINSHPRFLNILVGAPPFSLSPPTAHTRKNKKKRQKKMRSVWPARPPPHPARTRVVVGRRRRSTNHSFSRFRPRSRFLGGQIHPLFLFPSLAGGLVDRSGLGLPVSGFHGISVRPPTDLVALSMRLMAWCFVVCWRRPSLQLSLVGSLLSRCELCRLVVVIVVVDIVVLICTSQIAGNRVPMERPVSFWSRPPFVSS